MTANDYGPLVEENPRAYFMLKAIEGDGRALGWLKEHRPGLYRFARAFAGDARSFKALQADATLDLEDLFEAIADDGLAPYLRQRLPDLHLLFEAVKGDPDAARHLEGKRKKSPRAELARVVRELYDNRVSQDEKAGPEDISATTAADMSCLIGDLHLREGAFDKAAAAFTRALETSPTVDAYEGRARAYQGLAAADERRAQQLRERL